MPLFHFQCTACGQSVDRFLSRRQAREGVTCPNCSARIMYAPQEEKENGTQQKAATPSCTLSKRS